MSDSFDQTPYYSAGFSDTARQGEAIGSSNEFLAFQEQLAKVAPVERPVLLVGERGSGKELAAKRLHYLSKRWEGPLVTVNCASLSPSLIESELFGHEAGSFTGATRRREGRFEAAEGGTLFLDELGLLPMVVQEKILRAVEYGVFERVGSSETVEADVRILGATNADLPAMAKAGKFKQDLLDRLAFEVLFIPPLRSRPEDIIELTRHFSARIAMELDLDETPEFSQEAIDALEAHDWPGNVRELKNVVERAIYTSGGEEITEIDFHPFRAPYQDFRVEKPAGLVPQPGKESAEKPKEPENQRGAEADGYPTVHYRFDRSFHDAVRDFELEVLRWSLSKARFHQGEAAKLMHLSYHQFRNLYRKYQKELKTEKEASTN